MHCQSHRMRTLSAMPATRTFFPVNMIATSALAMAGLVYAAPADAGRGNPAPIVYKGQNTQGSTRARVATPSYAGHSNTAVQQDVPPAERLGRRIEFRYPDQPGTVYGAGGARQAADTTPIAFSSAKAAIAPQEARQYASVQAPASYSQPQSHDPAITKGGFDARATAARIAKAEDQAAAVKPVAYAPPPVNLMLGEGSAPAVRPATNGPKVLTPAVASASEDTGVGIVYGNEFVGQPTANGEIFAQNGMTAAHPNFPLPSLAQVVNTDTGREVVVRVNDRGPFEDSAKLQVSQRVADVLGFDRAGRANVSVRYLGPAPAEIPPATTALAPQPAAPEPVLVDYEPLNPVAETPKPQPAMPAVYTADSYGGGEYFVQVGSFADIGNAKSLNDALSVNLPVEIKPARVRGADFFRVRVGPFETRNGAEALRDHLAAQGIGDGRVIAD